MTNKILKRLGWTLAFVVVLLLLLFGARFFILKRIEQKVVEQLQALRDSGYIVQYDSININTRENTLAIFRLAVKRGLDSAICSNTDFLSAKYIQADGFRMLPLLLKRRLSFSSIQLDSAHVTLYRNFFSSTPDEGKDKRSFSLYIDELKLPNTSFNYYDSSRCQPSLSYTSNFSITGFFLSFEEGKPPEYDANTIDVQRVKLSMPLQFYALEIARLSLDQDKRQFSLDTLKLIPQLDKVAFGRKLGKEIDHIEATIPYVNLYGLDINRMDTVVVSASKMTLQFFFKVFRDKRLPFKNDFKSLPVEALHALPFGLKIDSLVLNKSYVRYEEFPEEADSSGHVIFDNLFATIRNITNAKDNKQSAMMLAESDFMGKGKLRVRATFPSAPQGMYTVNGNLRNFELSKLNAMLEPQARLRIESGHLDKLSFNFKYNNEVSNGILNMNYNNLKVVTFRTEEKTAKRNERRKKRGKGGEQDVEKAPLKTFVLNTIVLKTNMDSSMPEEKRNGVIHFERDKRKSIFNFWSKSMLAGMKNLYKLDKLEDSKLKELLDGNKNK